MSTLNYVNYNNITGLVYAIKEINDFTWIKDKYKEIFIDDLKIYNIIKDILGYVPDNWNEFFTVMKQNKEILKYIENLFNKVYATLDYSTTLISDVTGTQLYIVTGTQSNYDCRIKKLKELNKIYNLNPECEDYKDIFGHNIHFHIENEFIKNKESKNENK